MTNFRRPLTAAILAAVALGVTTSLPAHSGCSDKHKASKPAMSDAKDIVDTAKSAGAFNTLIAALKEADLVNTLRGDGPFTVFAPSDAAFAKIPEADLNALLKDKAKLTKVLTYHVVPGSLKAADVVKASSAKTVEGSKVPISVNSDGVKIGGAQVTKTDILCKNGVVHVIDAVILPPSL